ncbi:hypothetical protein [Jiangella asiatica]|uniref:DUF695 domain-containing protein n=1 Tax=Jiangella asiatica TaxID=2530372 RepID=A0A4R5D4K3_9ACTN|nr:hypothetical protein [Jiangella asiatica]TDE08236.1 hypothetical protein E1269_18185 [Jiangella asiatica]
MAFFRRKSRVPDDPRPAIAQFWAWWAEHRGDVLAATEVRFSADDADVAADDRRSDDLIALLRPAIAAIDPSLNWELARSTTKRFTLVVSSGGKAELRALAERWALAAPDDPDVEFAPVRRADPSLFESAVMKVDDYDVELRELVAGTRVDVQHGVLDVVIHHPLFPLLDREHRLSVAFLGLDAALGEDDAERWIGEVEVSADAPIDAIPVAVLGTVVDQLRPAGGQWAVLRGTSRSGPIVALVRRPLDRVERPLADTHVAVVLDYEAMPDGQPREPAIVDEAEKLGEQVLAELGGDGPRVIHVGRVTGGGQIVVHYYVDGLEVDASRVGPVLEGWTHGTAAVQARPDPGWKAVAPLLR